MITTLNAIAAARTMTLSEYRLWWYEQIGLEPPKEGERLSVKQETDERIIREGYRHRRSYEVPIDSPFCPVNQARRTGSQPPEHDAGLRDGKCRWTDGEQDFSGEHQFENGVCATCGQSGTGQPRREAGEGLN